MQIRALHPLAIREYRPFADFEVDDHLGRRLIAAGLAVKANTKGPKSSKRENR